MKEHALALAASLMFVACAADPGDAAEPGAGEPARAESAPSHDLAGATVTSPPDDPAPSRRRPATDVGSSSAPVEQTPPAEPPPAETPPVIDPPIVDPPVVDPPVVDPNPKPTGSCSITKDAKGFFARTSTKSSYVAFVPSSYDGSKPMRLIVGLHGCGDSALNFAGWGVNPYATRTTQDHIGISIGGRDGACWSLGTDDDKVLAAVDDIAACFWIHRKKVVIAGFSSGGQLAYRVGLKQASRFAGILIENSGLYAADSNPDALLANAAWKINIAHRTHTSDTVFPLSRVKADWAKTTAAGFPLLTSETPGGHDGTSDDWSGWLIPASAGWVAP